MREVVVPIRFINQAGSPVIPSAGDPANCIPVIDVAFIGPSGERRSAVALIDTGADCLSAKAQLISDLRCSPYRKVTETNSVGGESETGMYELDLQISGTDLRITTDVTAWPSSALGRHFDAIIGRLLLQNGALLMDYPNSRFEWRLTIPD